MIAFSKTWVVLVLVCLFRLNFVHGHGRSGISSLMSKMTLEEKIAQMAQVDINDLCDDPENENGKKKLSEEKVRAVIGERGVGSVLNYINGKPFSPKEMREAAIFIQEVAKNYSRPPVIWGLDSVHGANYVHGAVVTPQPLNIAATFNKTVARMAGALASRDTRAVGINWLFSPLMGIALEPFWSRVYETFGEDPLLVTEMGKSFIAGIQEDAIDGGIPSKAAACAKHFVGYSLPHNGHDRSPSWIPTRHLYQYFLPPWIGAVQDENVLTIMESYTETDGVPNVANPNTLRYLLRQRLGFEGVLVTDYEEILNLNKWHHITSNDQDAVIHSLREGSVDMSMIPHSDLDFRDSIRLGINNGSLVEERINESVERVLHLKDTLHMFHEELTMDDPNLELIGGDVEDGLDMARQSIVLTKNEDNTLPVDAKKPTKILVTGPTANSLTYQSGGWTGEWQGVPDEEVYFTYGTTVLDGMKSTSTDWTVKYSCGVDILGNDCEDPLNDDIGDDDVDGDSDGGVLDQMNDMYGKFKDWAGLGRSKPSNSMERAATIASKSDLVVVCIGEESYTEKPGDIRSAELAAGQYELVGFLKQNTEAKVVLVYFGGRPRLLRQVVDNVDAILIGFLPGPSAGKAVADIINGKVNPSGKLPITYPMYQDGGGSPYFHTISGQCTSQNDDQPLPHWGYVQCDVQWPFGFGLSYTYFEYSQLSLSTKRLHYSAIDSTGHPSTDDETLTISVNVKNKGAYSGYETVFFFTFDLARTTTPEYKRLRAFEKIFLAAGEAKTVSATISVNDLKFIGPHDDTHFILENGLQFRVGVGAGTDCREQGENSALCSDSITVHTGVDYIGACDAACEIWADSGCADHFGLSSKKCWSLCTSVSQNRDVMQHLGEGEDGWGWNYVGCLESVVWGFHQQKSFNSNSQCPKMISLCRDIFVTGEVDPFGHGPDVPSQFKAPQNTTIMVALFAGLVASALIVYTLRGGFQKGVNFSSSGDVQFTRVSNEDALTI